MKKFRERFLLLMAVIALPILILSIILDIIAQTIRAISYLAAFRLDLFKDEISDLIEYLKITIKNEKEHTQR